MHRQLNSNPEVTHSSLCNSESPSPASRMFSHSQHFTVTGGTFINVTNHYVASPSLPSDFRMIPMGDIDLRHQIRVDEIQVDKCTGVVTAQPRERVCIRRVHSAKARIDGRKSRVTVAIYQGNDAEEKWRNDIAKYMSLRQVSWTISLLVDLLTHATRHPNIIQICAAASSNGIHATLFNDDLIPLEEVLHRHRDSPVLTVYIYACCEVHNYIASEFHRDVVILSGLYNVDTSFDWLWLGLWFDWNPPKSAGLSRLHSLSLGAETITTFIDSLRLEQYHTICGWNQGQYRWITLSAKTVVNVGAVFHCSTDRFENSDEIAYLPPSAEAPRLGEWTSEEGTGEVMPNGWTRFQLGDIIDSALDLSLTTHIRYGYTWLSQANHIFRRLNIISNFKDYVVVDDICFHLDISPSTEDPPLGFLFLCPPGDFQDGPSTFCWPACPAYWSFDPSGTTRLSLEEATRLGFPLLELTALVYECSWDARVYEGLRQFHQVIGFDPYSQDVARHLSYPLYRVSPQTDASLTYVNSEAFDVDIDDNSYVEEYGPEYGPTLACDDPDPDIDSDSSHNQETVHDFTQERNSSEHREELKCESHDASELTVEDDMIAEEISVPSLTFRMVLYVHLLVSILFLASSRVYDYV
ncbi:hypothetical protein MSAN_02451700 [Mycena sanguinolenta]|uniref:Uncharacterized protein n=1 Tax=Mycena sanguinolenta TaxID=230812 RepID=A0A8H6WY69_9AGAR|nr:hypothetical protein MSAN_02451700 [Mycena sanguinolenta]